jgi:hypothetical protein
MTVGIFVTVAVDLPGKLISPIGCTLSDVCTGSDDTSNQAQQRLGKKRKLFVPHSKKKPEDRIGVECIEVNQKADIKTKHANGFEGPTRAASSSPKYGDLNFAFQSANAFQI